MKLTLLQVFFILSAFVIFVIAIDFIRKKRLNGFQFFIFLIICIAVVIFTIFPSTLNKLGDIFGIQRGADILVYAGIVFLIHFCLTLLNKIEVNNNFITKIIREFAINESKKEMINGEIVFIIAAYNEGSVIGNTIDNLLENNYKNIIVVNDGSKDNTYNILKKYNQEIILLNHFNNRGQGAALETGFEYVRKYGNVRYVCTYDADGQHQLKDLKKFLDAYLNDSSLEIVLGSRFIKKTNTNFSVFKKILLHFGKIFTLIVSRINLTDTHNGYRVLKKETLNKISISLDGMGHASEIIDVISTKKIKYKEVPVDILYTDYSKAKGQKSTNAINIAFKTIWYKFFK